jgi:integrase
VEFKFGVGLRTPEAAALLWRHCSAECDRIWIGESLSNGNRKSTKTNKARTVPLTDRLQQILLDRRGNDFQPIKGFSFYIPFHTVQRVSIRPQKGCFKGSRLQLWLFPN